MAAAAENRAKLVRLLRLAYSGELAAAFAYAGHARSVRDPGEAADIARIEREELEHRRLNLELLTALGEGPSAARERMMRVIGSTLSALCQVTGWLLPMYGAAYLETKNVKEYDDAADYAAGCDHPEMVDCLRAMADVELEHERYFKGRVASHWLGRHLPLPACTRAVSHESAQGSAIP